MSKGLQDDHFINGFGLDGCWTYDLSDGESRIGVVVKNVTEQIIELIEKFEGQFMRPDIRTKLTVSQIDNKHGESRFAEQGEEYLESDETITAVYENACLCRLSAPGYLDATEWTLCHDENDILEWIDGEAESLG